MKIDANKIPIEGLVLEEEVAASDLDLETGIVKFSGPLRIRAEVSKITNVVTVELSLSGMMHLSCSRCLNEFDAGFQKGLMLNYQVDKAMSIINLDQDIKEEVILDYPLKPLCNADCKGLCFKCGKNLNEGGCTCAIT